MKVIFWIFVIVFRILNSCLRESFCHFDELAHSLEMGHHFAFGYGDVASEWRVKDPNFRVMGSRAGEHWYAIRASFHPFIYAGFYYLLKIISLDCNHYAFVYGPRVLNGLFCFLLDYSIYHYSLLRFEHQKEEKEERAKTCLFFSIFCSCNIFLGVRFFSNSLEAVLTSVALWMWAEFEKCVRCAERSRGSRKQLFWCLVGFVWLALFAFFLRMSNCLFWGCHALLYFVHDGIEWQLHLRFILRRFRTLFYFGIWNYVLVVLSTLVVTFIQIGLDRWAYGEFVFPMYNNFMFNVVEKKSDYWGVLGDDYYFFWAIPLFLQGFVFFLVVGVLADFESFRELFVALFVVVFFSKIGHKENRFIFPTVPFFLSISERGYHVLWKSPRYLKRILFLFCCVLHMTTGWIYLHEYADKGQAKGMWDAHELIADNKSIVIIVQKKRVPVGANAFIHLEKDNWKIGSKTQVSLYMRRRKIQPDCIFIHKKKIHIFINEESYLKGIYRESKVYKKGFLDESGDDYVLLSKTNDFSRSTKKHRVRKNERKSCKIKERKK